MERKGYKYFILSYLILFLIFILYSCSCSSNKDRSSQQQRPSVQTPNIRWEKSLVKALKKAKKEKKPIIIDFYAPWCGWCRKLQRDVYPHRDIEKLLKKFVCLRINGEEQSSVLYQLGVGGYPTIVFLNYKGEEVTRIPGYVEVSTLSEVMEKVIEVR